MSAELAADAVADAERRRRRAESGFAAGAFDPATTDYDERRAELAEAGLSVLVAEVLAELVATGQAVARRDDAGRVVFRKVTR